MRFKIKWFNPFRNPFQLFSEGKAAIKWLNRLEDTNPEYRKHVRMGNSAVIGMMMQFLLVAIIYTIGVSLFD